MFPCSESNYFFIKKKKKICWGDSTISISIPFCSTRREYLLKIEILKDTQRLIAAEKKSTEEILNK